jgi:hypothetical protein
MQVTTFKRLRHRPKLHRLKSMRGGIFAQRSNSHIGRFDRRKIRHIRSRLRQSRAFAPELTSLVRTSHHCVELKSP